MVDNYRYESSHYKYLLNNEIFSFNEFKGKNVLEIGCGLGADLQKFAISGARISAVDAAKSTEVVLKKRFLHKKNYKYNFKVADFKKISFKSNSFDMIYSFGVLHHSYWIEEGIKEAYRLLKNDGEIIIMIYHKGFKYYVKKVLFKWILNLQFMTLSLQDSINKNTEEFHNSPCTLVFSKMEAIRLLEKNHFKISRLRTYRLDDNITLFGRKFFVLKFILPNTVYLFLEKYCGWNLLIRAKKII